MRYVSVGVDYCTVHYGIRDVGEQRCDFVSRRPGDDGRECVLHEVFYQVET